jgi:hypothetical protein
MNFCRGRAQSTSTALPDFGVLNFRNTELRFNPTRSDRSFTSIAVYTKVDDTSAIEGSYLDESAAVSRRPLAFASSTDIARTSAAAASGFTAGITGALSRWGPGQAKAGMLQATLQRILPKSTSASCEAAEQKVDFEFY